MRRGVAQDLRVVAEAAVVLVIARHAHIVDAQTKPAPWRSCANAVERAGLTYPAESVRFDLTNGPAVSPTPATGSKGSGMGLVGMREPVALLDGQIEAGVIADGPLAGGWRVTVTLPG